MLCVYWWLVLLQPSLGNLPGDFGHVHTIRRQNQQNLDWELLGLMLLQPLLGQTKASETTDLGKLKGLGRVSSRKPARKVRVSSPSWAAH